MMFYHRHKEFVGATALLVTLLVPTLYATMLKESLEAVDVKLSEYKIEMPGTLPAGPTTFNVVNTGNKKHNLEIKGQGTDQKLKSDLEQGESGTMQIDLKPGTYQASCPVGNHDHKGMKLEFKVTP